MQGDGKWRQRGEGFRGMGMALALPFVLVGGPVVCTMAGYWASKKFGWDGWIVIGVVVGLYTGITEAVKIVRRLSADSKKPDQ